MCKDKKIFPKLHIRSIYKIESAKANNNIRNKIATYNYKKMNWKNKKINFKSYRIIISMKTVLFKKINKTNKSKLLKI
jgi:hypothetical protein